VRKNLSPIGDIAERLPGDPCAPEKIRTPQEFASLSMGSNPSAPQEEKIGWGGRIRRLTPYAQKAPEIAGSSVPSDLVRFLSKSQEAILSILILQSVLKR